MDIDEESQKFIAWAMEKMDNEAFYHEFLVECKRKFANYIAQNPKDIRVLLKQKLIAGAPKHGAPIYEPGQVDPELAFEYIDILGWSLVKLYNERRK